MSEPRHPWIGAADAAQRLGVSRATLYAYVSRGFIRSQAQAGSTRERTYSHDDVERLRRRTEERKAPDKAAAHALQWGMPILESSIALIDGHTLYYRGHDAATLARSRSLEDVAALIWTGQFEKPAIETATMRVPPERANASRWARPEQATASRGARPEQANASRGAFVPRAQSLLAAAAARDPVVMDLRPTSVARTGVAIVRLLTRAATQSDPRDEPIDAVLARAWKVRGDGRDVLRAALVLCADHELNVSSFTARCVASAGSHPYAVVIAGLAALEGPKHGGASARAESMLESMRGARPIRPAVAARLRRGESIDGFGHPLYRDGDPRARLLLDLLGERYAKSSEYRFVVDFVRAASGSIGEHPNLDFALASVARVLRLPPGSPLMLFAIGRSVGWIGHAIEQYATNQLIRPRAKYVGVPPASPA
jgi:citrate synthase